MKKTIRVIAALIICATMLLAFASCGAVGPAGEAGPKGDTGATGAKGDQGDKGDKGDKGDTGVGIESVAYNEDGTKLIVTYTDGTTHEVPIPQLVNVTYDLGAHPTAVNNNPTKFASTQEVELENLLFVDIADGSNNATAIYEGVFKNADNEVVTKLSGSEDVALTVEWRELLIYADFDNNCAYVNYAPLTPGSVVTDPNGNQYKNLNSLSVDAYIPDTLQVVDGVVQGQLTGSTSRVQVMCDYGNKLTLAVTDEEHNKAMVIDLGTAYRTVDENGDALTSTVYDNQSKEWYNVGFRVYNRNKTLNVTSAELSFDFFFEGDGGLFDIAFYARATANIATGQNRTTLAVLTKDGKIQVNTDPYNAMRNTYAKPDEVLGYVQNTEVQTLKTLEAGQWHSIKFVLVEDASLSGQISGKDLTGGMKVTIYVDGEEVAKDLVMLTGTMKMSAGTFNELMVFGNAGAAGAGKPDPAIAWMTTNNKTEWKQTYKFDNFKMVPLTVAE